LTKKNVHHNKVLSVLNMQYFWSNLHQIFIIETLQVKEPIPKKNLTIQIIVCPWCFFKDSKVEFLSIVPYSSCITPLLYNLHPNVCIYWNLAKIHVKVFG
jgi:hypothetical protein